MTASSRYFALVVEALDLAGWLDDRDITTDPIRKLAAELEALGFTLRGPRPTAEAAEHGVPGCKVLEPHYHEQPDMLPRRMSDGSVIGSLIGSG